MRGTALTTGTAMMTPQIKNLNGRVRTNKRSEVRQALLNNVVRSSAKQKLEVTKKRAKPEREIFITLHVE